MKDLSEYKRKKAKSELLKGIKIGVVKGQKRFYIRLPRDTEHDNHATGNVKLSLLCSLCFFISSFPVFQFVEITFYGPIFSF